MGVCVLGSINVDVVLSVAQLPRAGETILASQSRQLPGGKAANQAVAAARMGARTSLIGAVGADEGGRWMQRTLAADDIDLSRVIVDPVLPTGIAYIAVDAAAENQIIVAPGANAALTVDRMPFLPEGGILLAQLEGEMESVAAAFASPDRMRILNAAPARLEARAVFDRTDILIVNQHELAVYLGVPPIATLADAGHARDLISRDGQVVIVTLGANGALAVTKDSVVHVPAVAVTPLDTVGAGDCFCGALAALLDAGESIEAALPLANAAAALSTQASGAIPSMPSRAQVAAFAAGRATEYARAIKKDGLAALD